jgi:DNA mismatch repair protein MutS2
VDDRVLELLELPKVLAALREGAVSPLGAAAASALRPSDHPAHVAAALAETTEARAVLERVGPFPLAGLPDLSPWLAALRVEGGVLAAPELVDVLHAVETAISARRFLRAAAEIAPRLAALAERLVELPHLATDIRRTIGPQYEILDDASPELARIRAEKERVRGQIRASLERLLADDTLAPVIQDRVVTQRNDRYVIPVKTNHRGLLQGVVHDQSQSRATYFLEPLAVVDANNQLALLKQQEKEEEWRILAELSASARRHRDALAANQAILAHLDLAQAKGRLSARLGGAEPRLTTPRSLLDGAPAERSSAGWSSTGCPEWGDRSGLALRGARHPLLLFQAEAAEASGEPGHPVVPVDIVLGPDVRTVLISGANAGGKTVALKTLGLLVLMAQAGLHIPASPDSELPVFRTVFAEIGDDQAIEQGVSSFSAHVRALARILREADGGSLVLLDELGTGTDPEEGSALAIAVLDRLRAQGALVVATTHLTPLKAYAYGREGAENVAVEFNPRSLRPTYRLIYGSSGQSNALAIARGFDFPAEVIGAAEALLAGGDSRTAALLRDIETARRRAVAELRRTERLRQRAAEAARTQEQVVADLKARRERILAQAREAAGRTVAEAEAEMRRVLEALKVPAAAGAVVPHVVAGAKGALRHARERLAAALRPDAHAGSEGPAGPPQGEHLSEPPLMIGDRVRVASLGREGDLVALDAVAGQAEVVFGSMKARVPLAGLTRFGRPGPGPAPAAGVRVEAQATRPPHEGHPAGAKPPWAPSPHPPLRAGTLPTPSLSAGYPAGTRRAPGPYGLVGAPVRAAREGSQPSRRSGWQGSRPLEGASRWEVNVIGLRVEEALPVVDKSLDDALLAGLPRLAIVHGTGTGRLRDAIQEFLLGHRAVRGVAGGDPAHGGAGVTLVELGG